jgi:hypothetical protein
MFLTDTLFLLWTKEILNFLSVVFVDCELSYLWSTILGIKVKISFYCIFEGLLSIYKDFIQVICLVY